MRFMLHAVIDTEAGNTKVKEGHMGETIGAILEEMKPEAAYFYAEEGRRSALVFFEMDDASRIPAVAEPWFLAFNGKVAIKPVMVADDLAKAGSGIENAVRKFG